VNVYDGALVLRPFMTNTSSSGQERNQDWDRGMMLLGAPDHLLDSRKKSECSFCLCLGLVVTP